ncbi:hypothetical protein JOM56_009679 [Amanita muscaria]
MHYSLFSLFSAAVIAVLARPTSTNLLQRRQDPTNIVKITSTTDHWDAHTNIGDSEHPGGETTYCTAQANPSGGQGVLPDNFWSNIDLQQGNGVNGASYIQLTGCINSDTLDRLNPSDGGGQYDSNGGSDGTGNPSGSVCIGYNSYVELVEPSASRACVRCCNDPADCPTTMDTSGCPAVIPGNYFDCA